MLLVEVDFSFLALLVCFSPLLLLLANKTKIIDLGRVMLDPVRYNAIYFISVKLKVTIAGDQFYFLRHVSYLLED